MAISVMNTVSYGTDTIHWFVVGPISTNCYAYVSDGECLVVDPGFDGAALAQQLADQNITTIAQSATAPGHRPGESLPPDPTRTLSEGDVVHVGTASFRIIETPGHSRGGICLVGQGTAEGLCFTGDTLFAGSAGRVDLPGGNLDELMHSLTKLKEELAPDCLVLPGHGTVSSMQEELATNRFYQ